MNGSRPNRSTLLVAVGSVLRVAFIAALIASVVGIQGLENIYRDFMASGAKQQLSSHLSEARTAIFAIKGVEYGWHDRTLSFDRLHRYHVCCNAIGDPVHSPCTSSKKQR